jgi:hypothetical protein
MSGALTVAEAFGPTLEDLLTRTLVQSRRPARTATCPVCGGTMRRLPGADDGAGEPGEELSCGECETVLVDHAAPGAGQLRLVR